MTSLPDLIQSTCSSCSFTVYSLFPNSQCPQCHDEKNTEGNVLICPLRSISQPLSICIRPSIGSFTKGYSEESMLHVGISNSTGSVFHFDQLGAHMNEYWVDCLCIELLDLHNVDLKLEQHLLQELDRMNQCPYHGLHNNCYSFVVRFLNTIQYAGRADHTRESLAESYVESPIITLERFLKLTERVKDSMSLGEDFVHVDEEIVSQKIIVYLCDICGEIVGKHGHYKCLDCEDFDCCELCRSIASQNHRLILK